MFRKRGFLKETSRMVTLKVKANTDCQTKMFSKETSRKEEHPNRAHTNPRNSPWLANSPTTCRKDQAKSLS